MSGLNQIRDCMVATLDQAGVSAVTAWNSQKFKGLTNPMVAVSLRGSQDEHGGFQDYLGQRYDTQRDAWHELYGKRFQVEFGLDIYAPIQGGAQVCQSLFDQLNDILHDGLPSGLRVNQISRGELVLDRTLGVFRCPVEAQCSAFLYTVVEEGGKILDFKVKGERI